MEVATLRKQKAEDAQVMSQTATLVQMLQESHTALVSSNTHLLAELQELKKQHAFEVEQFQRNFDEISAELGCEGKLSVGEEPAAPIASTASIERKRRS
eukprot:CAMPEP_0181177496 /NCGR_PEP_ID=MMETSP1096-20121128/5191_1 /TAXON_ID=156174 ORGANISM="Chrysochromulina ericina, Strain CCMP281" /NCGR_SAMPLE_ID=MMETSP1096 /ASSEMBLY_ACC=CAM_ASM_000453 /LENGTH=98 /DNA_ID=CAMNT_0023265649 /DNA_START=3 /DNA_END=299 /DNA_ORIENTATION=+